MVLDWDTLKGFPVVALPVVGEPQFQTDGHHGKFVAMPLKGSVAMSENGDFVSLAQSCCPIIDVNLAGCSSVDFPVLLDSSQRFAGKISLAPAWAPTLSFCNPNWPLF